mmetsp:Transcript_10162/g.21000  ORF Transcript_10162/g.21000 Transcript_10162/m.21000 type:complete len:86 (+) Transcript_10162:622-879(+)
MRARCQQTTQEGKEAVHQRHETVPEGGDGIMRWLRQGGAWCNQPLQPHLYASNNVRLRVHVQLHMLFVVAVHFLASAEERAFELS